MSQKYYFRAIIEDPGGGGAYVTIPFAVEQAFFNRLSYTHQKKCVRWITEAKRQQTRQARIQQTIELIGQQKSEP